MIRKIQNNFVKDKMCSKIFSLLNKESDTSRFVGGCVRDSILGIETNDIDIATKLEPEEVSKILLSESIKVIPTGLDHGTVSVFSKKLNFEITTLRSDIETDGRHAKVLFTDSWKIDASRRDFTINSIYLKQNGEIYDPFNGIKHLKEKKVVFIGDPKERIEEDYLRILRFFRFNTYYGKSNIDLKSNSVKVCKKNKKKIKKLSPDRVQNEFYKIINYSNPYPVIYAMNKIGLLEIIFNRKVETKFLKKMALIDANNSFSIDPIIRIASLIFNSKMRPVNELRTFNFSKKEKKKLNFLTNQQYKITNKMKLNQIKEILYLIGKEPFSDLARLAWSLSTNRSDNKKWEFIFEQINKIEIPTFPVKANDIKDFGINEGPIIGKILDELEQIWISSNFNYTKEKLLYDLSDIVLKNSKALS